MHYKNFGDSKAWPLTTTGIKMLSHENLETRLYLPRKPTLTETSLSDKDYCELSTKFKACHIKIMVFWVAKKTREVADGNLQVSRFKYIFS